MRRRHTYSAAHVNREVAVPFPTPPSPVLPPPLVPPVPGGRPGMGTQREAAGGRHSSTVMGPSTALLVALTTLMVTTCRHQGEGGTEGQHLEFEEGLVDGQEEEEELCGQAWM